MVREIVTDMFFLGQKSTPATKDDKQIISDLLDTINANADRCVGMAANMIGVSKTILVALMGKEYVIMINPVITDKSKLTYETEEGCLSLEGARPVTRYKAITVEYFDKKWKKKKQTFKDFEAQIIQHEMDHFEGKII